MVPSSLQTSCVSQPWRGKSGRDAATTHSLGFFFGPGLPRCFGAPSAPPLAAAAERLTPFFLEPSAGGGMAPGVVGVPSAWGVAALESDAFSPLAVAAAAGWVEGEEGDCLTSSTSSGGDALSETISRSLDGSTLRVTTSPEPSDFRRASLDLAGGAIAREDDELVGVMENGVRSGRW